MKDFHLRTHLLSTLVGFLTAALVTALIWGLDFADSSRQSYPWLALGMPIVWIGIFKISQTQSRKISPYLIFQELDSAPAHISIVFAPLLYAMMFLSLLVGASVGREGLLVQICGAVVVVAAKNFPLEKDSRRALLAVALASAFGMVTKAPWAGLFLTMELAQVLFLQTAYLSEVVFGIVGVLVFKSFTESHIEVSKNSFEHLWSSLMWMPVLGLLSGGVARIFVKLSHLFEAFFSLLNPKLFYRGLLGVLGLMAAALSMPDSPYLGLGYEHIDRAYHQAMPWYSAFAKLLSTSFSIGLGFKGGEFVPSLYMGSHIGNFLAQWGNLSIPLCASVGSVAVFAAAANLPLTCVVLGVSLFGFQILPHLIVCIALAFFVSGERSVYAAQGGLHRKKQFLKYLFKKLRSTKTHFN